MSFAILENTIENKNKTTYTYIDNLTGQKKKASAFIIIDYKTLKVPRVLSKTPLKFPEFPNVVVKNKIILRENQIKTGKDFETHFLKKSLDCILVRDTAFGKTIISLYFFTLYQKKTLIIVNRLELLKQWETKIKLFLPDTKIGKIQGTTFDIQDITLATVQTLTVSKKNEFLDLSQFYCTFFDEIHLFSSQVFSNILYKINSPFRIGLTATLERKDNKQELLLLHLPLLDSIKNVDKKQKTKIFIKSSKIFIKTETNLAGKINYSRMVTDLTLNLERNKKILVEIKIYLLDKNRKIIVMSDRLEQLNFLLKETEKFEKSVQLFTGNNKVDFDPTKKITFATFQLAGVGFDLPELNTLLFASPRSDIRQILGRIYRKKHLIQPIVIDFKDSHFIFKAQLNKRKHQYKKLIDTPIIIDSDSEDTEIKFLDEN